MNKKQYTKKIFGMSAISSVATGMMLFLEYFYGMGFESMGLLVGMFWIITIAIAVTDLDKIEKKEKKK